jgi:AcrR family transcriptional regulator
VSSNLGKERIIEAAVELFKEKGYSATSVQDIADKLGYTKAALYYYIPSKEEVLWEIFDKTMTTAERRIKELMNQDMSIIERIEKIIHNQIMNVRDETPYMVIFFTERAHLPEGKLDEINVRISNYEKKIAEVLREGIALGVLEPIDVLPVVYGILGMCNWLTHWFNPNGSRSPEEIAKLFSQLVLRGIVKK